MSLVTTADVLISIQSSAAPGTALYSQIDMLRRQVERAVRRYCKWEIEANDGLARGDWIEYYDGKGYVDIALRKPWASRIAQVRLDMLGAFGRYNAGFATDTILTDGTDYAAVFEMNGKCASGLLRRLGNTGLIQGWWPGSATYNRGAGGMAYRKGPIWPAGDGNVRVTYDWGFQPLTAITVATWAAGVATFTFASPGVVARPTDAFTVSGAAPAAWNGDYSVASVGSDGLTVTARIATDPAANTTLGSADFIPLDIKMAVAEAVGQMRNKIKTGLTVTTEGLGDYSYSGQIATDPAFGDVRQLLSGWRDLPLGI